MMKTRELLISFLKHVAELVCLDEIEKPPLPMFKGSVNGRFPNTNHQPHIIGSGSKVFQKSPIVLSSLLELFVVFLKLLVGVHVVYLLCNLFYTYIIKYYLRDFN
jgi:hypothetical protein